MYDIYVILHFVLMLVWVAFAITLDFRFLRGFNMCSNEERVSLMRNVRALSDRTEMPASTFLPLLGILMLIENSFWLRVPVMHGKILLALIAIGLYHAARGTSKRMMIALEVGDAVDRLAKRYMIFRLAVLVLLVSMSAMIISSKGEISAFFLIRSWFN
ncbi:MAG: hypothetical protein QF613_07320 [Candidatus Marinimicrobia bacterium]|jgi:uncharacterized membrane protein|nr:hypothetical protein [Candidatus Neomarinimicrobiota bacterium]MDP6835845.1 hypothetical protein [Candidatus Neomarinimicrobiota bacterium]MDP6965824.1 hypothetical protein [Candidatus Neomarinimicrobiota bacterium]|tara:strand:- start:2817 stop:3293 length:477 start_codon:yes stop_codon:yes gene_type:complete